LKIIEGRNFGEFLDILPSPLIQLKIQRDLQKLVYSRIFNSKSVPILNFRLKGKLSLFFHSFSIKRFIIFEVREMWFFIFQSDEFLCHQKIRAKMEISMGPACHPPAAPTWPSLTPSACCTAFLLDWPLLLLRRDDAHTTRFHAAPCQATCCHVLRLMKPPAVP
jgi:hypothetical protein